MRRLILPSVLALVGLGAAFALLRSGTSSSGRTRRSPPAGLLAGRTLGLFVDPSTGTTWEHEHGPRGGDELNIIARGHNYGWPAITYGINYNGTTISKYTARDGMDQPLVHWTPSISPSGLTIYSGDRFPEWRGNVFLGALSGLHLRRLELRTVV
jgi:glucose/arabinose dehydrogenase